MTPTTRAQSAQGADLHQIGEVADLIGLSLRTIRHYDDVGVVVPSGRTSGGFRLYTDHDVDRLRRVMGMKPAGFSLEEIREVLEVVDAVEAGDASPGLIERLRAYASLAAERRDTNRERLLLSEAFTEELIELAGSAAEEP